MPRRIQFSLSRLVGSLSLCCIAGGLWRQSFPGDDYSSLVLFNPFAFTGFVMAVAAGVGILFQRALLCAFAAYLCFVVVAIVAMFQLARIVLS